MKCHINYVHQKTEFIAIELHIFSQNLLMYLTDRIVFKQKLKRRHIAAKKTKEHTAFKKN